MKKKITSLMVLTMMMFTTIFAAPVPENVNRKVQSAFAEKFSDASNVHWSNNDNYIKASFKLDEQFMFAYFNAEGDYLGVARNVRTTQLPLKLQTQLKKELTHGWISELLEFANEDETTYYATIENADQKTLLKADAYTSWEIVKKNKKD